LCIQWLKLLNYVNELAPAFAGFVTIDNRGH